MITRAKFLKDYPAALSEDAAAVFVGAGVSMAAGYPSWSQLLKEIAKELHLDAADVTDLAALAQWHIGHSGSQTGIRQVIRDNIGKLLPVPETLRVVARLPLRHLWTTNYDRLLERSFEEISRPYDVIAGAADLSIKARPGASRIYKMHGSIERLDDLVISTDDYELYRSKRGAYLPLLQAHLMSMSMLFIGLSFTDPNVRHVLSSIRESFTDAAPENFAIVRPPQEDDFRNADEFKARLTQHEHWVRDLRRYGLLAVEVDDYSEVPKLMGQVERRVAEMRVWISGSWPMDAGDREAALVYSLSEKIGSLVGIKELSLVTGAGLVVGPASIAGFLATMRSAGGWDLDRRLIARPFPQPFKGGAPPKDSWTALRKELARLAGTVIFIGGKKRRVDGTEVIAGGVIEEFELAKAQGAFLLPIGATGGAAEQIMQTLYKSAVEDNGSNAQRPTDSELEALSNKGASESELVALVEKVIDRIRRG